MRYGQGQELRPLQIFKQRYCWGCRTNRTQTLRQLAVFGIYNTKTLSREMWGGCQQPKRWSQSKLKCTHGGYITGKLNGLVNVNQALLGSNSDAECHPELSVVNYGHVLMQMSFLSGVCVLFNQVLVFKLSSFEVQQHSWFSSYCKFQWNRRCRTGSGNAKTFCIRVLNYFWNTWKLHLRFDFLSQIDSRLIKLVFHF